METSICSEVEEYLRMDLTKSDLFLEILSFLEGVSQFLAHDLLDPTNPLLDEDKIKMNEQRKSLHTKSNYLWKLFDMSIHDETLAPPYLNMKNNQKKILTYDQEQTYDYCSFEMDHGANKNLECPFETLKATEVMMKDITMKGELLQIERRSFFGRPKTMFVILIDRWMLIYGSKVDKRPIQCILIKRFERIPEECHTNAFRIYPASDDKPSEFQCLTLKQVNEWISGIETALKLKRSSHSYVNIKTTVNTRKLPTPPTISYRKSNKSDEIYEEPDLLNVRKSNISQINVEKDIIEEAEVQEKEQTYDNVDHHGPVIRDMPHIPVKLNTFKPSSIVVCPNYDIPKNNRRVTVENKNNPACKDLIKKTDNKSDEKENILIESPKDILNVSHSRSNSKTEVTNFSTVQNTEEIKEKLRQQGIVLTPIKSQAGSSKSSNKFSLSPTKDINKKIIKNWFKTKLNKGSADKEKRKSTSDTILHSSEKRVEKSVLDNSFTQGTSITTKTVNNNGSKVNMIIHQLEANGHLKHLLTKTKAHRRHTVVDDSYELVSASQTSSSKEVF